MRKFIIGTFICSLLALAGCQKNDVPEKEVEAENTSKEVVVTASIKGAEETRTAFTPETDENGKPYIKVDWKESGESFIVYGDSGGSVFDRRKFKQVSGNQFSGELPTTTEGFGYYAFYKSTYNNTILYDISQQDGTLNDEYSVMIAHSPIDPVSFEFVHQTLILKPTFKFNGEDVDAKITEIVMGGVRESNMYDTDETTITVTPDTKDDIYIFVPNDSDDTFYKQGHVFTFEVIIDGWSYNASLTLPKDLEAGKFYTATINLTAMSQSLYPSCYLPSGEALRTAINANLENHSGETFFYIEFGVGYEVTASELYIEGTTGAPAFLRYEGNTLYICTTATENFVFNEDCSSMFEYHESSAAQMNKIYSIDFNNCCETSQVTNMADMFYFCENLMELKNMNFNTENVTNMSNMFSHCGTKWPTVEKSYDLSSFNTSKVTDMSEMFNGCRVTSIDVSNFNTSNVKNMAGMFSGMSGITTLDLTNFNTENVTDMSRMFSDCSELTSLTMSSNFSTSNVTTMKAMFTSCGKLTSLNLLHFNTENVTDMSSMFQYCWKLEELKIGSFKTPKVTTMDYLFHYCTSLPNIYIPNFVDTCDPSVNEALTGLGRDLKGTTTLIEIKNDALIVKFKEDSSGINDEDTRVTIKQIYS